MSENLETGISTVGGVVLSVVAITTNLVDKGWETALLAAVGATVSFCVTKVLQHFYKKLKAKCVG